ncbi:MAG: hypothetical protein FWD12_08115, partial [Alphaproteobacteria bacterium]|nr:hypothetical protein [Alphaproteobacteria bacterium]
MTNPERFPGGTARASVAGAFPLENATPQSEGASVSPRKALSESPATGMVHTQRIARLTPLAEVL